jgi:hypothetical protein
MALSRLSGEKPSATFAKLLLGGLLLGSAAVMLRPGHQMADLHLTPPVHVTVIDASGPPPVFDPEAGMSPSELMARWEPAIADAAKRFHIPAAWIRNVMRSESAGRTVLNGQPIQSNRGALGLMQVEPGTYAEMAAQYRLGNNPFDPRDNIYAGAAYLRWLHGKYGFPAMFAAYNAGPGQLEGHLHHGVPLPKETRLYVAGITKALGKGGGQLEASSRLTVTAPNGRRIALETSRIRAVRAVLPGEYAPGVAAVIDMGRVHQGVKEKPDAILAEIGPLHHRAA